MTPYREPQARAATRTHRIHEPLASAAVAWAALLLTVGLTVAAFDYFGHRPLRDASLRWLSPTAIALASYGAAMLAWARRAEAWVVLLPRAERVRVVTLRGLGVDEHTLRLSRATSAEYAPREGRTWLVLIDEGGRIAPVLPATGPLVRSGALEKLESVLAEATGGARA